MRLIRFAALVSIAVVAACSRPAPEAKPEPRKYLLERVDDAAVVQAYADGFVALPLREKTLIWHLYNAAIAGRDIYYDQVSAHGLEMREILESILTHSDKVQPETLAGIRRYAKLFWINSGPYNNLTARKFVVNVTPAALAQAVEAAATSGATFPLMQGESLGQMLARLGPMFLDPAVEPMNTAKTPPAGQDILTASHNNLYSGVKLRDLAGFKERYPLNSRVVKDAGGLKEEVYRVGGRYSEQLTEIVRHLEAAKGFATPSMAKALDALITWYRSGEAADRRAYDIAWVEDKASPVDTINGFTEVYLDARAAKGAWEALVFYVNREKTDSIRRIAADAQWFEDRMPWDPKYRKVGVKGITANAIDVVVETGDSGPTTPVGINLPNDDYVREHHGSKSVSLSNINEAYEKSADPGMRTEFAWTPEEAQRTAKWGELAGELTTNMHEVIGHASGRISERLNGKAEVAIGEYYSALEEGRADLVGLYFLADPKMVELKLMSAADQTDIVLAEYESYARNALLQLRRVREGTQLEEDHMRNRQMIVNWLMANTKSIEKRLREGKTYYVMVDAAAFREGVGRLLAEVQHIKSEGDRAGARKLFDTYGIHFDAALRDEVVRRVDALHLPSYTGFVLPRLEAVTAPDGAITDVKISYPQDLSVQMLEYADMTRDSRRAFMAAEHAKRPAKAMAGGKELQIQ
ncbi:MAG: peptidase M49 [Steroidobacteraceae bacterium]